jgi:hypothetical protein
MLLVHPCPSGQWRASLWDVNRWAPRSWPYMSTIQGEGDAGTETKIAWVLYLISKDSNPLD